MQWIHDLASFGGGAVLINAIPHVVSGLTGRAMQTPFARPPGRGRSSAIVNVGWGFFNLLIAWLLLARVAAFDPGNARDVLIAGLGGLLLGLALAHHFGRFNGGRGHRSS